jgi:hypothetical protein
LPLGGDMRSSSDELTNIITYFQRKVKQKIEGIVRKLKIKNQIAKIQSKNKNCGAAS